ncbi:MAG: GGDEF domain-containing protein [Thermoleophilaceae bacterium]
MSPIIVCIVGLAAGAVGAITSLLLARRALSTQRAQLDELRGQARTDTLTGLANRRTWEEELPRELARARRSGRPVSIVVADLDGFKAVNDTEGHQAGDRLLKTVAAAFRGCLREVDVVARFGGDEFGFVLPDCREGEALKVAGRLRRAAPAGVTCSLGVAGWDGAEPASMLFERADQALYDAKHAGRNRVGASGLELRPAPFPRPWRDVGLQDLTPAPV